MKTLFQIRMSTGTIEPVYTAEIERLETLKKELEAEELKKRKNPEKEEFKYFVK